MPQPRVAVLALLGLLTVTAAGFAVQQYRRAEDLAAALAAAQAQSQASAAKLARTVAKPEPTTQPEAVVSGPEDLPDAPPEATDGEAPPRDRSGNRNQRAEFAARMEKLMQDPEFVQAMQLQERARLDRRYATLFAKLNLPPAQLEALKNLLAERDNSTRDVMMAAREQGLGRDNRDELRTLIETTRAEIDAEIRTSIGEQNFAELSYFEQTGAQRNLVDQLSNRLSYSATPLNSSQSEALVKILAETSAAGNGNATGGFGGGPAAFAARGGNQVTVTDETIARAQGVLSSTQITALTELQAEQKAAQKVNQLIRAARTPSPTGG